MAKKPKNKKIMFLCAHNQSRSVAGEGLLTGEKGYEVKSRALWKDFPRRITKHEGQWADEVFVMMPGMIPVAEEAGINKKKIKALWIPDNYGICDDALLMELKAQLRRHGINVTKSIAKAKADCFKVYDRKMGFSFGLSGKRPWWEAKRGDDLYGFGATPIIKPWSGVEEEDVEPVFEEEISGHVTRPRDRFSYHEYVPPPERYVPVRGDESEEEIVERARRLWKFYDATDPKQKKIR